MVSYIYIENIYTYIYIKFELFVTTYYRLSTNQKLLVS